MLLALSLVACKENEVEEPQIPVLESRAVTPGTNSETNPTLLTDWENCTTIYFNSLGANGSPNSETAPWANGTTSTLEESFRKDVKKADGWRMLFHTFCKSNLDVDQAYMCLYNIFTGYVKIFYYTQDPDVGPDTRWQLSSNTANVCQGLFSENEFFSQPINDPHFGVWSIMADNQLTSNNPGTKPGWNGFQFRVGEYRPNMAPRDLTIQAYNYVYTNFNFDGKTESTTTGTIKTINSTNSAILNNPITDAVLNEAGDAAKKKVDEFADKHLNHNFIGMNTASIISRIGLGDYVGAIKSGLGFIFGRTRAKTTYSISEVELQSHGTVTISGKGETAVNSKISPFTFNLDQILATPINDSNIKSITSTSSSKVELGVWNLRKKPVVRYSRYTKYENLVEDVNYDSGLLEVNGLCDYPETTVDNVEIVFNPIIQPYIKNYSVTVGLVDVVGGNRSIDRKGKHTIFYNHLNTINTVGNATISGINNEPISMWGSVELPAGVVVNDNTQYYIDWGTNTIGYRAAVVALSMDIDYNGNQFNLTESRVYDVDYAPIIRGGMSEAYVNNPPYTFLLNKSNYFGFDF